MQTRKLIVIGCVTGALSVGLFIVLATIACGSDNQITAGLLVLSVADVLMGISALKFLGDAFMVRALERCTARYVEGVSDTVDRLAEALPKKDNVRRIG